MKSKLSGKISYTLFGQSHSKEIGITIEGLPQNFVFDFDLINKNLLLRQGEMSYNTARQEKIDYKIIEGYSNKTIGNKLTIIFENKDIRSKDYEKLVDQPRPGHADYTGKIKYGDDFNHKGGSHFSGRMSAPLVVAGSMIEQIIKHSYPNLEIITHIKQFQDIKDLSYYKLRQNVVEELFISYGTKKIATLSKQQQKEFASKIKSILYQKIFANKNDILLDSNLNSTLNTTAIEVKNNLDSAGGELETIIINMPNGLGNPFFDSLESVISHMIYSIPSVKGISFGDDLIHTKLGTEVKDEFIFLDSKQAFTLYNFNGGINGGISNGEDIIFTTSLKPIASIASKQSTYSYKEDKMVDLEITGRHDSTIINRIIPIINAMTYIALAQAIFSKGDS